MKSLKRFALSALLLSSCLLFGYDRAAQAHNYSHMAHYYVTGYSSGYSTIGTESAGPVLPPVASQVFSGPAYISPANYHYFVQSYSWASSPTTAAAEPQPETGLVAHANSL